MQRYTHTHTSAGGGCDCHLHCVGEMEDMEGITVCYPERMKYNFYLHI